MSNKRRLRGQPRREKSIVSTEVVKPTPLPTIVDMTLFPYDGRNMVMVQFSTPGGIDQHVLSADQWRNVCGGIMELCDQAEKRETLVETPAGTSGLVIANRLPD